MPATRRTEFVLPCKYEFWINAVSRRLHGRETIRDAIVGLARDVY